jgi:DNA-3-methyladenine glycosylase II
MQGGSGTQSVDNLPSPERWLAEQDLNLAALICSESTRWPSFPNENPIWGLMRIVMAQQVSTLLACRLAERAKSVYPAWVEPSSLDAPEASLFKNIGLSQRRAECCAEILRKSDDIQSKVRDGRPWEQALVGIKGIGPWTLSVFKIMVLRERDVLPLGDVGLERAIRNIYGGSQNVAELSEKWRPFRSVACWYLWRTLGNEQLG